MKEQHQTNPHSVKQNPAVPPVAKSTFTVNEEFFKSSGLKTISAVHCLKLPTTGSPVHCVAKPNCAFLLTSQWDNGIVLTVSALRQVQHQQVLALFCCKRCGGRLCQRRGLYCCFGSNRSNRTFLFDDDSNRRGFCF